jgi:hypothetical protein
MKGKGRVSADAGGSTQLPKKTEIGPPTCGICLECFLMMFNPGIISKGPTSSMHLLFSLFLPCPKEHRYCFGCLKSYLQSKLAEGNASTLVFPIRCPECPIDAWSFEDGVAAKILDSADMVQWVRIGTAERKKMLTMTTAFPKATRHHPLLLLPEQALFYSS